MERRNEKYSRIMGIPPEDFQCGTRWATTDLEKNREPIVETNVHDVRSPPTYRQQHVVCLSVCCMIAAKHCRMIAHAS